MRVAFRADASDRIGAGHVMRCLALADELRARGASVAFLCRTFPAHRAELLEARGFDVRRRPPDPAAPPDAPPWALDPDADAAWLLRELAGPAWDWIVVDHYALDAAWESAARSRARRVLALDDGGGRRHDADLLLNPSLPADPPPLPSGPRVLAGPRFALLARPFRELRDRAPERSRGVRRVLICFGGSDPGERTEMAVAAAARLGRTDLAFDVVLGGAGPDGARRLGRLPLLPGARLHGDPAGLPELMAEADLSIGAAGTMTWERCCLRLPAIVLAVAANQEPVARTAAAGGAIRYLGPAHRAREDDVRRELEALAASPPALLELSRRAGELTDGRGCLRVADEMEREQARRSTW